MALVQRTKRWAAGAWCAAEDGIAASPTWRVCCC